MKSTKVKVGVALAATSILALVLATWAIGGSQTHQVGAAGNAKAAKCGLGNGKKATGKPIKLGTINMLIPGVDFTTIAKIAQAYFKCVNDNGGIHGRPIQYIQYTEQLNPAQQSTLAHKLVESDKVVGIVGNTSFTECGTNWKYYKSKHFTVIGAGVQAECFGTPPIVESNMGPRYSNIGAAQALLKRGAKSLIIASPNTIAAYADGGVLKLAKAAPHQGQELPDQAAGDGRQLRRSAARPGSRQGRRRHSRLHARHGPHDHAWRDRAGSRRQVKWGSSTPIANTFMAKQFPQFDGKIFINNEFQNLTNARLLT